MKKQVVFPDHFKKSVRLSLVTKVDRGGKSNKAMPLISCFSKIFEILISINQLIWIGKPNTTK